ncbi:MAG: TIGR01620 family protein [Aquamicrobium sp.]|uniref:YcjF family protein n=1 Tax=Aquamicrobium sp. TaxID=1872579 RepID=UPI00349EF0C1|nr:TIGR01620 family protein [Aquamicrobium sp.]
MKEPRQPAAFRIEPARPPEPAPEAKRPAPRQPRAAKPETAVVVPAEIDVFDEADAVLTEPPAVPPRRRSVIGRIFLAAFGLLVSLALGLWVDGLIRDLFARSDWLGWLAAGVAVIAALALVTIIARELVGLARLASVETLREAGRDAMARNDPRSARKVVDDLAALVSRRPETAAGRRALKEMRDDVIDGADLVRLAEAELLGPLDARAQTLILDAAKRVSLVTAVSPRALIDIAYVLYEAAKLIRRLAELYGARPGTLGMIRLARDVLAHLAVTGAVAAGDEFVHQIVGQGLAARLSAKLGEGVVNGMMTARIGVAAMETVRPLPFAAVKRPGMGDFLSALAAFTRGKARESRD